MLKNYISIAYRNLLKSKAFSLVNILGLAIGMAVFLSIVHYVRFERSYEDFHTNADNIYRITLDLYNGSEYLVTDCETHAAMGPILKAEMPEVTDFVRMYSLDGAADVRVGEKNFWEQGVYFTDPSVFNIFSLKVLNKDSEDPLKEPFNVVITESMARKYFGRTDAAGEQIFLNKDAYHVSAVIADLPPNTHLKYLFLISHSTLTQIKPWYKEDSWNGNNEYTYLLMAPGTDLAAFNKKLFDRSASLKDKIEADRYHAEKARDIHLYSNKTYEPEANGSAKVVSFLALIALFIIVIAWVNYINLSTARAIERAREVGIRKVMGSVRGQLILQFLSESVIVNVLAGVIAFGFFQAALPFFRELTGQPLPMDIVGDAALWYWWLALVFVGSLLSGLYPSLVLSAFQPAAVLKGKFRSSPHGQRLRQALVVFQFSATVILMICMGTVYLQIKHMRNYDLGMNLDQALVLKVPPQTKGDSVFLVSFNSLKTALLRNAGIQKIARSEVVPGIGLGELNTNTFSRLSHRNEDSGYEYYFYSIDADFIPALGMKLVAGRNFQGGPASYDEVIVNEETVKRLGFAKSEDAVGEQITFRRNQAAPYSTIVGVVRNYHYRSPKEAHLPMLFNYYEGGNYMTLKTSSGDIHQTIADVKTAWDKAFPGNVFSYFFLNERYDQQFKADAQFGKVVATFSALAVFIACLGLFGLSSYTIVQRTKEIGIRKVLGASVIQIVHLLTKDFARVILTASLIALPVAYLAMEDWLSNYAVRIGLNAWLFAAPVALILLIALGTVSFQTIRTALENPVQALKQE